MSAWDFADRKHKSIEARKAILKRYLDCGHTKAESERLAALELFREVVREYAKKVPVERLKLAIDESMVEEVLRS